jgi:hypothetical protein
MKLVRHMRSRWLGAGIGLAFGGLVAAFGATSVAAQDNSNAEEACTPDVMSLCYDAVPDRGKIVACLRSKRGQVSLTCRQAMGKHSGSSSSRKKRRNRS